MSDFANIEVLSTVLQVVVLVVVIAKTNRLIINEKSFFLPFFFALAMASFFLSDVYWFVYDVLKPDTRMPIAANEFGECAMILLLSAGLETLLTDKKKVAGEIVYAVLYTAANIALWIVWTGEWLQDILFGIPYAYFLWVLIRGMRTREMMGRKELFMALAVSIFVLINLSAVCFVDGIVREFVVQLCYVTMFTMMVWLGVKSFRRMDFFVTSTFFLWTNLAMFATPVPYYYVSFIGNTVALPLMLLSMKKELLTDKEIVAHDLC